MARTFFRLLAPFVIIASLHGARNARRLLLSRLHLLPIQVAASHFAAGCHWTVKLSNAEYVVKCGALPAARRWTEYALHWKECQDIKIHAPVSAVHRPILLIVAIFAVGMCDPKHRLFTHAD
jgi:hypothetical protein